MLLYPVNVIFVLCSCTVAHLMSLVGYHFPLVNGMSWFNLEGIFPWQHHWKLLMNQRACSIGLYATLVSLIGNNCLTGMVTVGYNLP